MVPLKGFFVVEKRKFVEIEFWENLTNDPRFVPFYYCRSAALDNYFVEIHK